MLVLGFTLALILVAVAAYIVGAIKLSKFAFRISSGTGLAVLLLPPYALYFAIFRLEESGKELPAAMCLFGIICTTLLLVMFWMPLSLAMTGDFSMLVEQEPEPVEIVLDDLPKKKAPAPVNEPAPEGDGATAQDGAAEQGGDGATAEGGAAEGEEGEAAPE